MLTELDDVEAGIRRRAVADDQEREIALGHTLTDAEYELARIGRSADAARRIA